MVFIINAINIVHIRDAVQYCKKILCRIQTAKKTTTHKWVVAFLLILFN